MLIPDKNILTPGNTIQELEALEDDQLWASGEARTLLNFDLGQLKGNVYKSSDGVLHIYLEAETGRKILRAQFPLSDAIRRPVLLFIDWTDREVRLRLDGGQPTLCPWQEPPAPQPQ